MALTSTLPSVERSETLRCAVRRAAALADQRRDLGALDRAQVVDDALGVALLGAGLLEVVAGTKVKVMAPPSKRCTRSSARPSSSSLANGVPS